MVSAIGAILVIGHQPMRPDGSEEVIAYAVINGRFLVIAAPFLEGGLDE